MKKPRARASKSGGRANKRGRLWPNARALLDGWALAPLGLWLLAQLEAYVWIGALLSELHFQLGLALALAASLALARKQWLRGASWLLCGLLFLAPLWPVWRPVHQTPFQGGPLLKVAQCQLAGAALSAAQLSAWLGRHQFDVVSATGIGRTQQELLAKGTFGYAIGAGESGSSLLFVRTTLSPRQRSAGHVSLRVGHCDVDISQLVVPSLLTPSTNGPRQAQLRKLLDADARKRSLYIGSLGSRSAASDLQALLAKQGLRDVRAGHGRLATGPSALGPLGLPLDHVLVHGWIAVTDADVAPPIVPSAHRTLQATLQLTEPRCR